MHSRSQLDGPAGLDDLYTDGRSNLSSVFAALANDDRLAILDVLREHRDEECPIERIAALAGLSRFATSRHLRILREAGLIVGLRSGHRFLHRVAASRFDDIDAWLLPYLSDAASWSDSYGTPSKDATR